MEQVADTEHEPGGGVDGRWFIIAAAVFVAAIAAYFAFGMPGMDHDPGTAGMSSMDEADMSLGVDDFAERMASPDAFVVNVHEPDEGAIAGTDATIPYRQVATDDRLPSDTSTPILLYCKTGRMSAEAMSDLMDAGYTDVAHLDGGMDAWVRAGRSLQ